MRTIKFRGKSCSNGDWFYGNLYDYDKDGRTHICGLERGCLNIDPNTVGQFTGLLDKNGKEIYEGDIVKVNDDYSNYGFMAGEIREVSFYMGGYRLKPKYESSITRGDKGFWLENGDDFEVIGNIHDNPELLKNND